MINSKGTLPQALSFFRGQRGTNQNEAEPRYGEMQSLTLMKNISSINFQGSLSSSPSLSGSFPACFEFSKWLTWLEIMIKGWMRPGY